MKTIRKSYAASLFLAARMSALLLVPVASGAQNTFYGSGAGANNTTGGSDSAFGVNALFSNASGSLNTASGVDALFSNTSSSESTAIGLDALFSNTSGSENTAIGVVSLGNNTTGNGNTASGYKTLYYNTTGNYIVALGYEAGINHTTGDWNMYFGNSGVAVESGVIRIGTPGIHKATYIAGIDHTTISDGVPVYINSNGRLGILTSSRRFKNDIHDMGSSSDKLIQLHLVTFRYKDSVEKGLHALQYGLIAEEVAKVYPELVQYDAQGKPFTIKYQALTPMLLNEFQKVHRQNVAHQSAIAALTAAHNTDKAEISSLKAALQAQSSELAALKQSQQQQLAELTKLTALVQASQVKSPLQNAAYTQH